jgi:hypothetical protein
MMDGFTLLGCFVNATPHLDVVAQHVGKMTKSIGYAFLFFGLLFINVVECLLGTSHCLSTYLMPLPVW